MSNRTLLVVILAVAFGTSAAVGVARLNRPTLQVETVGVVVVARDTPRFTTLTTDTLKIQQYPRELVPPGSVTRVEDLVDRVTDTHLVRDEPVVESRLAPKGAGRGMAATIPKGMRAVTIRTPNIASGVAGFILPGNRVDVLFTIQSHKQDDPSGGGSTKTLTENVEILAVDQRIEAPSENKMDAKELKSVTLLVTPEQAAEIDLAQTAGTLHLTLRNPLDTVRSLTGTATLKGILTGVPVGRPAAAPAKTEPQQPAVAVAPPPTPVSERFLPPEPPPRVRTLRGGVPGRVYIE
jgi:pilus assembly protein CpaB